MRYNKYFKKDELLYSKIAKKLGINQEECLRRLPPSIEETLKCLSHFLGDVRIGFNRGPIYVSSAFRCREVNLAVGGVRNSLHQVGAAADIYVCPKDMPDLYKYIKNNYKCDELYINYTQNYIHVSPSNIYAYGKGKSKTDN